MNREEMTIDEAIAIIRKEYLCVDRDCDIERSCGKCDLMMPSKEPILEAYKMAIKALEQEPCEDAIDRKLISAFLSGLISDETERKKALQYINELPSVNPQPKTGHWIWCVGSHKCSNCEEYTCFSHKKLLRYCPNCGAKMQESEVNNG